MSHWKPVWHILEDEVSRWCSPTRSTSATFRVARATGTDAAWIADLLAQGLIAGNFVPPAPIQELRDLTRTRKQLVRENRAAHVAAAEDAGYSFSG